jgi:tyrosyl-tRNA synthetase
MPEIDIPSPAGGLSIVQILKQSNLAPSTTEANRLIEQGGVKVDGDRVAERSLQLAKGRAYVIQVGKRKVARITLA